MIKNFFASMLAVVAVLAMVSCNGNNNGTQQRSDYAYDSLAPRVVSNQIAYVNMDSLMMQYDLFIELSTELEAKAKKAETDLTSRGRSLERNMADAQEKVEKGLVTRAQIAQVQEDLQKQEANFVAYRDRIQSELAEENQVMMNRLFHSIDTYLKEFNKDYRYGMILSTSGGSPILNADPALDITAEVLQGLNEAYAREKE